MLALLWPYFGVGSSRRRRLNNQCAKPERKRRQPQCLRGPQHIEGLDQQVIMDKQADLPVLKYFNQFWLRLRTVSQCCLLLTTFAHCWSLLRKIEGKKNGKKRGEKKGGCTESGKSATYFAMCSRICCFCFWRTSGISANTSSNMLSTDGFGLLNSVQLWQTEIMRKGRKVERISTELGETNGWRKKEKKEEERRNE